LDAQARVPSPTAGKSKFLVQKFGWPTKKAFPRAKKKNAFPGLRKCERRINREDRYQICSDAVFGGIELGALTRLLLSHSDQTDRNNMSRERRSAAGVSACRSGGRVPLNFSFAQSSFLMA
jgi:hypothetical protein